MRGTVTILILTAAGCAEHRPVPKAMDAPVVRSPEKAPVHTETKEPHEIVVVVDLRDDSDPALCPVHNEPLSDGIAPISSGLPQGMPDYYYRDEPIRFPYARTAIQAGCASATSRDQVGGLIHYCESCRSARAAWLRTRGW